MKVYIVVASWRDKLGDNYFAIVNVTADAEVAKKALKEERGNILEGYPYSFEEAAANNNEYRMIDHEDYFYIEDFYAGWDELQILEREI